jgi:autotransporter-associated beta strand protein
MRRFPPAILAALALAALQAASFAAAEADLLVAFDNSYTDAVGGDDNAEVLAANSVAASNAINENSGTGGRMRICGYHKTWNQGGRSSLGGYCGWMWNYGDGNLDDVTAAADAQGADLVAFICAPAAGEGAAAVAYQPGRYAAYGTGSFWNNVVAHESGGHNYGCDHRGGRVDPKTIMLHNYCGGGSQGWYSNPNIRLNGVRLLGEGSCLGAAVSGGDNAYLISTTAQGVADRNERQVRGSYLGALRHRWQFNRAATAAPHGTMVTDSISGATAVVRGQGAAFTGSGLRLPGGTTGNTAANSIAAYVDLPNGIFSAMPNFTVEIWATPLSTQNWMRVFDIGRTVQPGDGLGAAGEYTGTTGSPAPGATQSSDNLMLTACIGTDLGRQRFEAVLDGSNPQSVDSGLATNPGTLHHYAITFADTPAGGTISWFRNGALIGKRNVTFHTSQIEDVNNWLGRSMWSGDAMSHIDYHDLRIQNTALDPRQVAANYRIGPNDAKVTLWANDAWGSSGFLNGAWEGRSAPAAGLDFEVGTLRLLTPWDSSNHTFAGRSLSVTGGNLYLTAKSAKTTTVNDLRLSGGTVLSWGDGGSEQTLAGRITLADWNVNHLRGAWGPMTVSARLAGLGAMLYTENRISLTADNSTFTGQTIVGDGRFSTLRISSETNLGGNPPWFGGDWLTLNRGILETTATMTIDDANRGVRIGPSGGIFSPAAGTTLTLASPVTSPAAGNTPQTAPMDSNPILGILFIDGGGTVEMTHPNNSHNAELQVNRGELKLSGNGRINNGDHWMPITINALFTSNQALDQTLRGSISGNGTIVKNGSGTLHLNGSNPFTGTITIQAGTLYANPGNAANNRALSQASSITVNSGGTLRAGTNGLFGWDGSQDKPVTVNPGGTLTANGGTASDVGVGLITLNGGTLATLAGGATDWGSWRFDQAGDKLLVTQNATVSATQVKFGNPAATIEVAAGKTLDFTGTVADTTNGGISYLTKTGTGTLVLAGSNAYSGATAVNAGTITVTGSIAAGSSVTVASGATLGGTGTVHGPLSFATNATHAPGRSTGTQTVGGTLGYATGARLRWHLNSNSTLASAASRVAAGNVTVAANVVLEPIFNASGSTTDFSNSFWSQARSWTVMTCSNKAGNFTLGTPGPDIGGRQLSTFGTLALQQSATAVQLVYTPYTQSDIWRQNHFGAAWADANVSGDAADPDRDDLHNLLEYALGSDPVRPDLQSAPRVSTTQGRLSITFTRNTSATDVTLSVMAADSTGGPWTAIARSTQGGAMQALVTGATVAESGSGNPRQVQATDVRWVNDPAQPRRFLRVEARR